MDHPNDFKFQYFKAYGTLQRKRDPKEIHEKLQEMFKRKKNMLKRSDKWLSSTPSKFYATQKSNNCNYYIIYHMNHKEKSFSHDWLKEGSKDKEYYMLFRDSELPLFINKKNLKKEALDIIKQRLMGKRKEISLRRDLHIERKTIDKKLKRIRIMISEYLSLLKKYLPEKRGREKWGDNTFMHILEIEGYDYHFYAQGKNQFIANQDIKRITL